MEEERKKVLQVCQDLVKNELVDNTGSMGNVSLRAPDRNLIAITPSQVRYDTMEPEDIIIMKIDGEIIDAKGGRSPTVECPTHLMIHKEIDGVKAVVHSHPTHSVTMGLFEEEIPSVHSGQAYFVGSKVPVIDYVISGSEKMGEAVIPKLEENHGIIIRYHGLITVGKNISDAYLRSLAVEENSKIYFEASCIGEPEPMDEKTIEKINQI